MLNFQNALTFKEGVEPEAALRNFFSPEGVWIWSTGRWAEVNFGFDVGLRAQVGLAELILDLDVFKHEEQYPGQNVLIFLNGLRIGSLFCSRRVTAVFAFDAKTLSRNDNVLTIDTPEAAKPSQFGGGDDRLLGVQMFSIQVRKVG